MTILDRSRLNLIRHYKSNYYYDSKNKEELTAFQKECNKAGREEYERDVLVNLLVENWTGKDFDQQIALYSKSKINGYGSNWYKKLLHESRDHMFKISKQMTDSQINKTLNDLREISFMAGGFGDILYQEGELRKRKEKIYDQ
jgi:hypothetical protein